MCQECGCGNVGDVRIEGAPGTMAPSPLVGATGAGSSGEAHHDHHHEPHSHDHGHDHGPEPGEPLEHAEAHEHAHPPHTLQVQKAILAKNDRIAERNRGFFRAKGLLVLNVVSAPGSGKTTFIEATAKSLGKRLRAGVIVGDLATDNDASRLRSAGVPAVQITTNTACHLEADMVARAMSKVNLDALDLLIIENVGNLVCPAMYDLGEDLRVVLLSVTEGEDKPLKYPPMFHSAHVAILTKTDLASATGFDRAVALANLHRISHHATVFEVSARTGAGMDAWCDFLVAKHKDAKNLS